MSFRFEDKISIGKSEAIYFFKNLKNDGYDILYPKRKICSIYFDNDDLDMFTDSEEGSIPRKKYRIRNYPSSEEINFNLEIKISSIEGRFKTTKYINSKKKDYYIKFGILDNQYGQIFPVCKVVYLRKYYSKDNIRVTHDTALEYYNYNNSFSFKDDREVVEIKTPKNIDRNIIDQSFPFSKHRFSKYCEAIRNLKIK